MDTKVWVYLIYLLVSIGLTVWVATTLSRNGLVFLTDVFADQKTARAINQLLVMGFYLLNLGYITFAMATRRTVADASQAMEILAGKIGLVLLVLGLVHLANLFFLGRYRRNRLQPQGPAARTQTPPTPLTHPAFPQGIPAAAGHAAQPYAAQPYAAPSFAAQPYAAPSFAAQPYTAQPYAAQPYAAQPSAAQPSADPHATVGPDAPAPQTPEAYAPAPGTGPAEASRTPGPA